MRISTGQARWFRPVWSITSTGKDAVLPEPICTPASSRSNLKVEINAEVEKILIEDKIAKGVVYHQNGTK
jgi:hypothetical protein